MYNDHYHHTTSLKCFPTSHLPPTISLLGQPIGVSGLYWLSLMLVKMQSLPMPRWNIVMLHRLKDGKHKQRINHHFILLPNGLCFVWMAGIVGCHLSPDDPHEQWRCLPHCLYLLPHLRCAASSVEHVFRVEWLSFHFSSGKPCSQCNGTLHLGHQQLNGILKNRSVCVLSVRLASDSLLWLWCTKKMDHISLVGLWMLLGWKIILINSH